MRENERKEIKGEKEEEKSNIMLEFLAINLTRIRNMGVVVGKFGDGWESLTLGKETKEGKCI